MKILQKLYLIRSFYTLCGNSHTEALQQLRDVQQQLFTVPLTNVIDQTLIQLDCIEMHDIQRRQRRISASEIIQQ